MHNHDVNFASNLFIIIRSFGFSSSPAPIQDASMDNSSKYLTSFAAPVGAVFSAVVILNPSAFPTSACVLTLGPRVPREKCASVCVCSAT